MSEVLEQALRWAAIRHRDQTRKGSSTPYFEHVVGVAMILDRLGFDEEVIVAGLLHDVVEDTETTFDEVRENFGDGGRVAGGALLGSEDRPDRPKTPVGRSQARPPCSPRRSTHHSPCDRARGQAS
jgi:hypothetical protein